MRAAYITGHGGNEVVCVGERPRPARRPGEVLVRLHAATVNQVDLYMRNSGAGITHRLPQIMGIDGAGVVEEADVDEALVRSGQSVVVHAGLSCGRCEFCLCGEDVLCTAFRILGEHCDGTFAEFVCVPARNVLPMPAGFSFVEAAALGVNFLTAWRMLFTKARLTHYETVLVFGVGGGVSLAGLQLAKSIGARAIVTSRDPAKIERALALGADHGIQSGAQDVAKTVLDLTDGRGVDVVFENVGAAVWADALKSLVRGGRLVTCGATSGDQPSADLRRMFIRQLQVLGSTFGTLAEFRNLLSACAQGRFRPAIDSRYPLDRVPEALDRMASARQFGKLAIDIGGA